MKIGDTATILTGILSGTDYEIAEKGTESGDFQASYSGTVTSEANDAVIQEMVCTSDGVYGTFPLDGTVHVIVTNVNQKAAQVVLPDTGGSGIFMYTIGGLLMVLSSAGMLLLYKYSKKGIAH